MDCIVARERTAKATGFRAAAQTANAGAVEGKSDVLLIAAMTGVWHFVFRDEFMALSCKTNGATGRE